MQNTDEIKVVITLTGPKRLPHLEAEIFADENLTTLYLNTLCKDQLWANQHTHNLYHACYYARFVMNSKWYAAEAMISRNTYWFKWYRDVLRRNFM